MQDTSAILERQAWRERAGELAQWAFARLVNRTDAWGAYVAIEARGAPRQDGKGKVPTSYTAKGELSVDLLARHFRGHQHHHVVGLHSTSQDNLCRWGAWDIDAHDDATDPRATLDVASRLYSEAHRRGFTPLLTTSNGKGGYHVRLVLSAPVPSRDLHRLLRQIAAAAGYQGEQFPKQAALSDRTRYGNWLRLPGLHHTRRHLSLVFNGAVWLDGADAVTHLLSIEGDDPGLVPAAPAEEQRRTGGLKLKMGDGVCHLHVRIARYIQKLPNLSTGQGRDDVAFRLAAFLVHDLQLSDDVSLPWVEAWDKLNDPPKGTTRLQEIIGNARTYGRGGAA